MIDNENNKKGNVMNNIVVRVEKSGNRFNAFDANGVKYTSQITTGTIEAFSVTSTERMI